MHGRVAAHYLQHKSGITSLFSRFSSLFFFFSMLTCYLTFLSLQFSFSQMHVVAVILNPKYVMKVATVYVL